MKTKRILVSSVLVMFILLIGCKSTEKNYPIQFEYLQVERLGGGQLDFRMYAGDSRSNLNVYVSSSDFQPVEKRFQLLIDENNMDAFDDFYKAINGQLVLNGTAKPSGGLTGTWLKLRFVRGNQVVDVTNPELLQRFTIFEKMVREALELK
ncbi:MAG TPA: hypothetical protein VFP20_08945 [Bacteroidales bacterium]|nr:hypothetical protein [Bacteroidales bacterium]